MGGGEGDTVSALIKWTVLNCCLTYPSLSHPVFVSSLPPVQTPLPLPLFVSEICTKSWTGISGAEGA